MTCRYSPNASAGPRELSVDVENSVRRPYQAQELAVLTVGPPAPQPSRASPPYDRPILIPLGNFGASHHWHKDTPVLPLTRRPGEEIIIIDTVTAD